MNGKMKDKENGPWMIALFPRQLRQVFVGTCHMEGLKVTAVLEGLVRAWLKNRKGA